MPHVAADEERGLDQRVEAKYSLLLRLGPKSGTTSDCKRHAASNENGHTAEYVTRRVWGGAELSIREKKREKKMMMMMMSKLPCIVLPADPISSASCMVTGR